MLNLQNTTDFQTISLYPLPSEKADWITRIIFTLYLETILKPNVVLFIREYGKSRKILISQSYFEQIHFMTALYGSRKFLTLSIPMLGMIPNLLRWFIK